LALARGGHDRLDHAGKADGAAGLQKGFPGVGETVGRGGKAQLLGGQTADAFAIHGQPGGLGRGDDVDAFGLQGEQLGGGDGLDLRDDEIGLFRFDDPAQGGGVEHADDMGTVGDLHGRGMGIAVHGDDLDAQALGLDGHLLAEFAGAEQHEFGGGNGQRRAEGRHGKLLVSLELR